MHAANIYSWLVNGVFTDDISARRPDNMLSVYLHDGVFRDIISNTRTLVVLLTLVHYWMMYTYIYYYIEARLGSRVFSKLRSCQPALRPPKYPSLFLHYTHTNSTSQSSDAVYRVNSKGWTVDPVPPAHARSKCTTTIMMMHIKVHSHARATDDIINRHRLKCIYLPKKQFLNIFRGHLKLKPCKLESRAVSRCYRLYSYVTLAVRWRGGCGA